MIHSRGESLAFPSSTGAMDTPSIFQSFGTVAPPSSANVGSRSVKSVSASLTAPAGTRPGPFTINGAHTPASFFLALPPLTFRPLRVPVIPPPEPLSVEKMMMVSWRMPQSSNALTSRPTSLST